MITGYLGVEINPTAPSVPPRVTPSVSRTTEARRCSDPHLVQLAEPGSTALTLTMRYVQCGAGVSTVSLRTHCILALGDEDLPAARQSGPSLRILRDWALLAAAGCFSCRQRCKARPSSAGARQEACAVCQGASDAPTGKVRRLTWVQMGPTWHF